MKLNWANRITITRILLIIPFVSCMLKINDASVSNTVQNSMRYFATTIFLVVACSDVLDGYLARRKGQTTKLGSFLDPMADKLLITCACLLLASHRAGVRGFSLPPTVVVVIIAKDLLLMIGSVIVYFVTSRFYIVPVWVGKVLTLLQSSMVTAILLAPEFSSILPGWIWFLRFLWWSAASTAVLTTLIYIRNGSRYIEQSEQANSSRSS